VSEAAGGEDGIEPGKRLIRAGDDRGVSLAERLSWRLHRLSWRTPLHSLRLRGRHPLKLLAVPKDPVAGDKLAGEAILRGRFLHRGQTIEIDSLDFNDPALPRDFSDYLQSFEWLRDLAAAATRERAAKPAEKVMGKWIAAFGGQFGEAAWRADLWGRRILFWSAYAPYILSSRDAEYRAQVLNTLSRGARHLDKAADKAPPGIARMTAWAGVIAAALIIQGGPARLSKGEAGLLRALSLGLHDDGGLTSRSPVEQLALVELLGQLRAIYLAGEQDMPDRLAEALEGAVGALLGVTLGDEALSNWQGGQHGLQAAHRRSGRRHGRARPPAAPAARLGVSAARRQADRGDLRRGAAAAEPRVFRRLRVHLAFELSEGQHRLVVNCGGDGAALRALPDQLAAALRTTAAHSTLTLGDRNSTAIHGDGTLGKGVAQVELARDDTGGVVQVEASHDGYVRRFGMVHQRTLTLAADGRELRGQDVLLQQGRGKRKGVEELPFAVRFHLAPAVEAATTADGQGALLRIRGGTVWQFRCRGGQLSIEDSIWIDGAARPHSSLQLVVTGNTPPGGHTIAWIFRRPS
jgi:uncharacterized heparinase superfamily protein